MTVEQNQLPLNQIFLGDSMELLNSLPDECVDLIVSSPPYNLGKEYEAKQALDIYNSFSMKVAGLILSAVATSKNSIKSKRRSPRSYFDT